MHDIENLDRVALQPFQYAVHCILPWDRKLSFQVEFESQTIKIGESTHDTIPDIGKKLISVQLKDQSTNLLSFHDLGLKFSFSYCTQLVFLHEKEYRHLIFSTSSSSIEDDGDDFTRADNLSSIEIRKIGKFLNTGYIANGLSIRFVGSVNSSFVGYGLFAESFISRGEYIGEYTGLVKESSMHSSDDGSYTFLYPSSEVSYEICAREFGNVMRFINHNSTSANVRFQRVHHEGLMHIVCFAISDILPCEQLLVNYGTAYWINRPCGPVAL